MNTSFSKKQVLSSIITLFSAASIGQVASGLSVLFTARPLGVEAFGQYAACFALTKLTSILFTLGTDTLLLREGRRGETPLGVLVGSNLVIKTCLGLLWLCGLMLASRFLDPDIYPPRLLVLCALATWMEASLQTVLYCGILSMKKRAIALLELSSSLGLLFATLWLAAGKLADPHLYAGVRLILAGVVALAGLAWFGKGVRLGFEPRLLPAMLRQLIPFALSDALVLVYTQADISLVAILLGTQAAGLYSPASGILRALFVIPSAVYLVMTPLLSQQAAAKSPDFIKTMRMVYLALAGVGAFLWLATSLLAPGIVWLVLGPAFETSAGILAVLGVILFLKSCSYASASVIVATTGQGWRVSVQAAAALANLLLNLLLLPRLGISGAAWAYAASEALLVAGYLLVAERSRKKVLSPGTPGPLVTLQ